MKEKIILRSKVVILFFIFSFFNDFSFSQLSALYYKSSFIHFTSGNLWDWTVMNNGNSTISGFFIVQVNSFDNATLIKVKSNPIMLNKGINKLTDLITSADYFYLMDSPLIMAFRQGESLSPGEYNICLNIYSNESLELSNTCTFIQINNFSSLRLIQPLDHEKLNTIYPTLMWTPYIIKKNIVYNLRLSPILEGQEKIEALSKNILFLNETVSQMTFQYPFTALKLEQGKKYAWQVHAVVENKTVASTEVWEFEINTKNNETPVLQDCYRLVKKNETTAPYLNNGVLKFAYDNRSNQEELDYQIINASKAAFFVKPKKILLHNGINKIDINLNEVTGLKKRIPYTLEISDPFNQHYKLVFKYN